MNIVYDILYDVISKPYNCWFEQNDQHWSTQPLALSGTPPWWRQQVGPGQALITVTRTLSSPRYDFSVAVFRICRKSMKNTFTLLFFLHRKFLLFTPSPPSQQSWFGFFCFINFPSLLPPPRRHPAIRSSALPSLHRRNTRTPRTGPVLISPMLRKLKWSGGFISCRNCYQ